MGLNVKFLQLMVWLRQKEYVAPGQKVMEIGAQQLNNSFLKARSEIDLLAKLCKVPAPALPEPIGAGPDHLLDALAPRASDFYRALGFDYSCLDIDSDPNSFALDLNFDTVPQRLAGKFNLITNFGTTEHIINQLNAFRVIHDLSAPSAIMMHELPALGQINHGLFGYQPRFFELLARSNNYSVLFLDFSWSNIEFGIPLDLQNILAQFVDIRTRPPYGSSPSAVTAVLRKNYDAPFVPPIDVPIGSTAPNAQMQQRYGDAFRPLPFAARAAGKMRSHLFRVKRFLKL
jgi:Methyltransferase domain